MFIHIGERVEGWTQSTYEIPDDTDLEELSKKLKESAYIEDIINAKYIDTEYLYDSFMPYKAPNINNNELLDENYKLIESW